MPLAKRCCIVVIATVFTVLSSHARATNESMISAAGDDQPRSLPKYVQPSALEQAASDWQVQRAAALDTVVGVEQAPTSVPTAMPSTSTSPPDESADESVAQEITPDAAPATVAKGSDFVVPVVDASSSELHSAGAGATTPQSKTVSPTAASPGASLEASPTSTSGVTVAPEQLDVQTKNLSPPGGESSTLSMPLDSKLDESAAVKHPDAKPADSSSGERAAPLMAPDMGTAQALPVVLKPGEVAKASKNTPHSADAAAERAVVPGASGAPLGGAAGEASGKQLAPMGTTGAVLESPFDGASDQSPAKKLGSKVEAVEPVEDTTDVDEPSQSELAAKIAAREALRKALTGQRGQSPIKAQSIIDFQRWKQVEELEIKADGNAVGKVTLVNLNPSINSWFLFTLRTAGQREEKLHLENPDPRHQRLSLGGFGKTTALVFTSSSGQVSRCDFLAKDFQEEVKKARDTHNAFMPLCDGKVFLRSKVDGRKTTKEWVVEFLRENVWGGESITSFVKDKLFKDKFLISSETENAGAKPADDRKNEMFGPINAKIDEGFASQLIEPSQLAISVKKEADGKMLLGRWYENPANRGVFVSAIIPNKIDGDLLKSYPNQVSKLDATEGSGVDYLVGFDMNRFDIGFVMGTDHPQVDWSERALPESVDRKVAGPDGFGNWEPLVTTGMVNPNLTKSIAAVFTGGFKRDHGSFKWGALSVVNHASHYGFIESGVVFSKLNPGLSTIAVFKDGSFEMKTWTEGDEERVKDIVFARQNGVALVEFDGEQSRPGEQVKNWGAGNWSGSEDSKFRTLRAGMCLQEHAGRKFLIYGYFSSVTPSAMARVFQAYQCRYAMHLDMNALEHTYLSVFPSDGRSVTYEHLISGMRAVDKSFGDKTIPRFIGFPDNRDFFYLWRKQE